MMRPVVRLTFCLLASALLWAPTHADDIMRSVPVQYFFPAHGTQNPNGAVPNWYFYWTAALTNGPHSYVAGVNFGQTVPPNADIQIGANAYSASGIPRHLTENFIDAFGIIVNHERWHRSHRLHNISRHGGWAPPATEDIDGDEVCDREFLDAPGHSGGFEAIYGTNPNTPNTNGIIDREWIAQQNETDPNATASDWARPGSQWP